MTSGRIHSIDEDGNGFIAPDAGGDTIPFEHENVEALPEGASLQVGDAVVFHVEGGYAGIFATHVRPADRAF